MSDPAIEAAERAWELIPGNDALFAPNTDPESAELVVAAREALKPVRELHYRRTGRAIGFGDMPNEDYCAECSTIGQHIQWPCATARLVYTSDELSTQATGTE